MVTCYLGLGSNLGNRQKNIKSALRYLESLNKVKIEKVSSLYETEPQGYPVLSPRFLNGVARVKTNLSPGVLLKELKNIETKLGRQKQRRLSVRPIDLDILLYGNKKINTPDLKIPHPRIQERSFVLTPLKEIAPSVIKSLSARIKIISGIAAMRSFIKEKKSRGKTIGFVPTMGYLHQGHLSLIRQAKKDNDICAVSIFVNPIQFGPKEDYRKYPRDLERDSILAQSAGCDVIFCPKAKDMYPEDYYTYINVEKLTKTLCGASRPGHFRGVATVVAKLFNIVQPDIAYFGQKDYQQALIIKKMAGDLNMPLKIKAMPIIRESDGLAMSSRNTYLNTKERNEAAVLYQSLLKAKDMIRQGERDAGRIISVVKEMIQKKKSARIDYVAIADAETLGPLKYVKGKSVIALAVWIGRTRLIDNIIVK